ncbi:hypothetical protein [Streptomyces sp. NPDC048057]|uniref:hypothetical protein n=1 Tax=Streptomyces sp. NPDC048057 TaxID=3155628 RepID=UPI003408ED5A
MREKYFVDWSDAAFPKILPIKFASEHAQPLTLTEAKREVVEHFQVDIRHAREQIRLARALRADEIVVG